VSEKLQSKPFEHQAAHGDVDERLTTCRVVLIVFAEAAISTETRQGSRTLPNDGAVPQTLWEFQAALVLELPKIP